MALTTRRKTSYSASLMKEVRVQHGSLEESLLEYVAFVVHSIRRDTESVGRFLNSGGRLNRSALLRGFERLVQREMSRDILNRILRDMSRATEEVKAQMASSRKNRSERLEASAQCLKSNFDLIFSAESDLQRRTRARATLEIVTIVRLAAGDLLPADFAEGLKDYDPESTSLLITFGADLPKDADTAASDSMAVLKRDLSEFIRAAERSEEAHEFIDPEDLYILIGTGLRLCRWMAGEDSRAFALAELNALTVSKHIKGSALYYQEACELAEQALAQEDTEADSLIALCEKTLPQEQHMPSREWIASGALVNGLSMLQGEAVRSLDESVLEAAQTAIDLLHSLRTKFIDSDAMSEIIDDTLFCHRCVAAEVSGDDRELNHVLKEMGPEQAGRHVAIAQEYEDDEQLVKLVEKKVFESFPQLQTQVLTLD